MTIKDSYNNNYLKRDYFQYNSLLYYAYIKSIIELVGLKNESTVLDVGCGQGFFSNLFRKCNMHVTGVDLSDVGIQVAKNNYEYFGIKFIATDVIAFNNNERYDCVFSRNFSLYNTKEIVNDTYVTDKFLSLLRKDGIYIFIYNTRLKLGKYSDSWRYHSCQEIEKHFSRYFGGKSYIVNKIAPLFLRKYAFNDINTRANKYLSEKYGFGVDVVWVLRK